MTLMGHTQLKISPNTMARCMRGLQKGLEPSSMHRWRHTRSRTWTTVDTNGHITRWCRKYCLIRPISFRQSKRRKYSSCSDVRWNLNHGGLRTIRKKSLALSKWIDIITLWRIQGPMTRRPPPSASRRTTWMSILTKAHHRCHFLAPMRSTSCKRWHFKPLRNSWESPRNTSKSLQKWINS